MAIHERLRTARRDAGYASAAAAANAFGWPIGTYSCHENGSRGIRLDAAKRYARAFGVDRIWLLYGEEPPSLGEAIRNDVVEALRQAKSASDEPNPLLAAWDEIRAEIEAGAIARFNVWAEFRAAVARQLSGLGPGTLAPQAANADLVDSAQAVSVVALAAVAGRGADAASEEAVGHVWFRREWMERRGIDPASCAVIGVRGLTTWPTLPDDYSIMVDQSRTEGIPGEDFVFRTRDGLVIKGIVRQHDGAWSVLSAELASEPEPYPDDADIFGQIVWAGRAIVEPVSE